MPFPANSTGAEVRIGPRPLGLHLATAALSWTGAALPGGALLGALSKSDPISDAGTMARSAQARFDRLLNGINAYQVHPYRRQLQEPPSIWSTAGMRLLDYGTPGNTRGIPLLIVPSLINRHYILDLKANQSLVRYLAERGFRPFLVAWDDFGRTAKYVTVDDCIGGKLEAALGMVRLVSGQAPIVIGYCLGGTLGAGLVARRSKDVAGFVSLAAPWDFHAGSDGIGPAARFAADALEPVIEALGSLPVDAIQSLFYTLDPFLVIEKFLKFADMDALSPQAEAFVAIEDWLNDGFPLPGPIARTLLSKWYGENAPALGNWHIEGRRVDLADLSIPSLVVVPAKDRIVPPESARAMARQIPAAEVLEIEYGHVGLIASQRAPQIVWPRLADWLQKAAGVSR